MLNKIKTGLEAVMSFVGSRDPDVLNFAVRSELTGLQTSTWHKAHELGVLDAMESRSDVNHKNTRKLK